MGVIFGGNLHDLGTNLTMDTSFFARRSSSVCSLNFPRPHQLGISTGIHLSRSSRIQSDSSLAFAVTSAGREEEEDVDAGPPPTKKAALSKKREKDYLPKSGVQPKPIIKSYDEKPLKEFSLFLPAKVPKAILHSRSALREFVLSTANTYLSLWELSSKMDLLELRIPVLFADQLCDDGHFLAEFLAGIFQQASHVKSVKQLFLPRITMHPLTQLEGILQPLVESKCSISHLFLPIKCSLRSKDLEAYNFKPLALLLRKCSIQELTFISTDEIVKEISDRVATELKGTKKSAIKINYSRDDLGAPGPNYIADLEETPTVGESVDPHLLISSLNATTAAESSVQRTSGARQKLHKSVS